jgi:N-acetylmuramoyl-L-alanine amidase
LRVALLTLAIWVTHACAGQEVTFRMPPTRPSGGVTLPPISTTRIGGKEYVSATDAGARLAMNGRWAEPNHRFILSDQTNKVELEPDHLYVLADGLRVHLGDPIILRKGEFFISRIDFERYLLPRLRPALLGLPPPVPRVIALDPGHGGKDEGMENKALGLKEKVFTLLVAQRLKKILEASGYQVVMTRTDDRQLGPDKLTDWRARSEIANAAGADLFVSIHFNSLFPDTKTAGTEVYAFTPQFQRSTRSLSPGHIDDAAVEAAPVNRFDPWSAVLAQSMQLEVLAGLKTLDRGEKTMHSAVLRGLNCPGVLVESVFLSNDAEAKRVMTPEYRQLIAESMAAGIRRYVAKLAELRPGEILAPATSGAIRRSNLPSSK